VAGELHDHAARRRPVPLSSGRTLPSGPPRAFDCGISSLDLFLMPATVFGARPAEWPIARSGMCGCEAMIRVGLVPVEECDVDGLASRPGRGHQVMHPVDHRMVRRSARIGGSGVSVQQAPAWEDASARSGARG
jgi:hypothetical protein